MCNKPVQSPTSSRTSVFSLVTCWSEMTSLFLCLHIEGTRPWRFWGEEESGHTVLYVLRGPSKPHSPTLSTIQYITIHPSPYAQQSPKYHIWSMKKSYLKTPRVMNDFIYNVWFIYNGYDGNGRKTPKYIQSKKQRKNPPFGCPPIPTAIKLEVDCFPGWKNRTQAGLTLGGIGILIYRVEVKWLRLCHSSLAST